MSELVYAIHKHGDDEIIADVTNELSVSIPSWIITHPHLSDRAVRLFAYMKGAVVEAIQIKGLRHVQVADLLNVSERTAREAVYELRDAGAIRVVPRFKDNAQIGNAYYVWPAVPQGEESAPSKVEGWREIATPGGSQLPADIDININKDNAQNSATRKKRTKQSYDEQFATLWKLYPRHVNKGGAYKAYCALMKKGVKYDDLLAATTSYATLRMGQDEQFTMYAATFFGPNNRWSDYLTKPEEADTYVPEGKDWVDATIYDCYDATGEWVDSDMETQFDNPAKYGYARPTNPKGQLVSASGEPYELDAQGQRKPLGYWK